MNGINKITDQIGADIQKDIDSLMERTRAQAAEIAHRYEERAGQEGAAVLERGRKAAAEHEERLVSNAKLEARKQILAAKQALAAQRWKDAENGYLPEYIPFFPEEPLDAVPEGIGEPDAEWFRFYALKRGHHVRARGGFTTTSNIPLMNFDLLSHLGEISLRPILFVVGDRAHSRFFSEGAYAKALEPKELYVVEDAEHIDLYDRTDRIPFDKIEAFLKNSLH